MCRHPMLHPAPPRQVYMRRVTPPSCQVVALDQRLVGSLQVGLREGGRGEKVRDEGEG